MNRAQRAARRAQAAAARTTLKQKRKMIALKKREQIKKIRAKYNNPWKSKKARINVLYRRFVL